MQEDNEESILLTLRTRNSRRLSRMLARNWKHQWLLLCPARSARTIRIVGMVINPIKSNLNLSVFLEASESARLRMGESLPSYHEDLFAGRGDNSLQPYNLVHKFIPMPQAMKIPAAKAAADKEWENLEKISAWNTTKVRNKSEWLMKQGRRAEKFILPHWWTSVIWRMPNWRQSTKNTKVELYSEVILWKMILDLMQYLQNKDLQHLKWQQLKSWISYPDRQGAQDKKRTQYRLKPK